MAITTPAQKRIRTDHLRRKAADPAEFLRKARIAAKKYRDKTPAYKRGYYVKERYNMTIEELQSFVDNYLAENGPVCAICKIEADVIGKVKEPGKRRLVVDHDHTTGKLRSMLCDFCNTALGKMQENEIILQAAIDYLKTHKNGNS
jgi:hypothetical protein